MEVGFEANGNWVSLDVEPRLTLADALREKLGLTGVHLGCEHGVCGACTVMVDREPVRACLMLAVQVNGMSVMTVEGLADPDGNLHPLQQAFSDHHALQCGFCTPGLLMSALHLLDHEQTPTRDRIREELSGNICRCTGYGTIVDAVESAATTMRERQVAQGREARETDPGAGAGTC